MSKKLFDTWAEEYESLCILRNKKPDEKHMAEFFKVLKASGITEVELISACAKIKIEDDRYFPSVGKIIATVKGLPKPAGKAAEAPEDKKLQAQLRLEAEQYKTISELRKNEPGEFERLMHKARAKDPEIFRQMEIVSEKFIRCGIKEKVTTKEADQFNKPIVDNHIVLSVLYGEIFALLQEERQAQKPPVPPQKTNFQQYMNRFPGKRRTA